MTDFLSCRFRSRINRCGGAFRASLSKASLWSLVTTMLVACGGQNAPIKRIERAATSSAKSELLVGSKKPLLAESAISDEMPIVEPSEPISRSVTWRLTKSQLIATQESLLGGPSDVGAKFPDDPNVHGFINGVEALVVDQTFFDLIGMLTQEVVPALQKKLTGVQVCLANANDKTCIEKFSQALVKLTWRKNANQDDLSKFFALHQKLLKLGLSDQEISGFLIEGAIRSPNYFMRVDAAAPSETERSWQNANFLSYSLLNTPPGGSLLQAAESNQLFTREQLESEVMKILTGPSRSTPVSEFFASWFDMRSTGNLLKENSVLMDLPKNAGQIAKENFSKSLLDEFFSAGSSLKNILSTPKQLVSKETAGIYGLPSATQIDAPKYLDVSAYNRAGLLTDPGFIASKSSTFKTNLVHRGKFVAERILCQKIPAIPPEIQITVPEEVPGAAPKTERDKFSIHASNAACASCHKLFDGLGFALEAYDPIGRFRTTEKGLKIDTTGEISLKGQPFAFSNVVELANKVAELPESKQCAVINMIEFMYGRKPQGIDLDHANYIVSSMGSADLNLMTAFARVAALSAKD